jgi:hypothetical protein
MSVVSFSDTHASTHMAARAHNHITVIAVSTAVQYAICKPMDLTEMEKRSFVGSKTAVMMKVGSSAYSTTIGTYPSD